MTARKYRQRGYQDDDREERPRQGRRPPRDRDRPRGRGLGAPTATVFRCARCGRKQDLSTAVPVDAVCAGCGQDLHTCSNCRHFDSTAPNECRLPVPQRIAAKSKRNECDLFEVKATQEFEAERGDPDDPRAAFDALFKL